ASNAPSESFKRLSSAARRSSDVWPCEAGIADAGNGLPEPVPSADGPALDPSPPALEVPLTAVEGPLPAVEVPLPAGEVPRTAVAVPLPAVEVPLTALESPLLDGGSGAATGASGFGCFEAHPLATARLAPTATIAARRVLRRNSRLIG